MREVFLGSGSEKRFSFYFLAVLEEADFEVLFFAVLLCLEVDFLVEGAVLEAAFLELASSFLSLASSLAAAT